MRSEDEINKPVTISNIEFIKLYGFLEWLRWVWEDTECQK